MAKNDVLMQFDMIHNMTIYKNKETKQETKLMPHELLIHVSKNDATHNLIMNHILDNFTTVINKISNRTDKIFINDFVKDLINLLYNKYNKDNEFVNVNLKQYMSKLNSSLYVYDEDELIYLDKQTPSLTDESDANNLTDESDGEGYDMNSNDDPQYENE
jgi:hypothetical protein